MTPLQQKITNLCQTTSVIRIPLRVETEKSTRLCYPTSFEVPATPHTGPHFIGFHDCMTIILARPVIFNNILTIAQRVPSEPIFGNITWCGKVTHRIRKHPARFGQITRTTIPRDVWKSFPSGTKTKSTIGYIHNLTVICNMKGKDIKYNFTMMELPAFTRKNMNVDYINFI